jgi:hypothetical protein
MTALRRYCTGAVWRLRSTKIPVPGWKPGADINAQRSDGRTAYALAMQRGCLTYGRRKARMAGRESERPEQFRRRGTALIAIEEEIFHAPLAAWLSRGLKNSLNGTAIYPQGARLLPAAGARLASAYIPTGDASVHARVARTRSVLIYTRNRRTKRKRRDLESKTSPSTSKRQIGSGQM